MDATAVLTSFQSENVDAQVGNVPNNAYDNRKYPRVEIASKIKYFIDESVNFDALSELSANGVAFETHAKFPTGIHLFLDIELEGAEQGIVVRGRVVRSWRERGKIYTAVEFTDFKESDKGYLKTFISELLVRQSGNAPQR